MPAFRCSSLTDFARLFERHTDDRKRRLDGAVKKAARQTRNYVARNIPRAFGELQDSLHVEDFGQGRSDIVADAPHADAVEVGSRPHTPPLDPLLQWVTLRGIQGLTRAGGIKKHGPDVVDVRREAMRSVARSLRNILSKSQAAAWRSAAKARLGAGRQAASTYADPATLQVARAIQHAISVNGTKPYRYMAQAQSEAAHELDRFVRAALPEP